MSMTRHYSAATVILTILFLKSHCSHSAASRVDVGHDRPQMVKIIRLIVPEGTEVSTESRTFDVLKVSQEPNPNYEVQRLNPSFRRQEEANATQKIKIYADADANLRNRDEAKVHSTSGKKISEKSERNEKQKSSDVLPLSIDAQKGSHVEYQLSNVPVRKRSGGNEHDDDVPVESYESSPNKRQTDWISPQKSKPESKILNRPPDFGKLKARGEPSYVDQNNPYLTGSEDGGHDRRGSPLYNSDYSSVADASSKRVDQTTYSNEYSPPADHRRRTHDNASNHGKKYIQNHNVGLDLEPVYDTMSSVEKGPGNTREYEVVRPSDHSKIRPINDGKPDFGGGFDGGEESEVSDGRVAVDDYPRNAEGRGTIYETEDTRTSNDKGPEYDSVAEFTPSVNKYSGFEKTTRPTDNSGFLEEKPTFERRESFKEFYDAFNNSSRPVRENHSGYSGFPESHQTDGSHHYSRPLQYEPARVFPVSPCLNVFKYEGREPEEDRWFADIYVITDEVLNGMRLDITLDRPAELLTVATNWLSDIRTKDSVHFTLLSLTHKLVPGPAETVRIMVKFNEKKPVPYLKSINLNGRLICPSNRAQKSTTSRPVYENPGDLQLRRTTERYVEASKRPPTYIGDYETTTKRMSSHVERRTTPLYEDTKKPTMRPPYLKPNPNGYEETDQNSFTVPPGKKTPGRPPHSNGKPPPHAARPAIGHGQGLGHGHVGAQGHDTSSNKGNNKNPGGGLYRPEKPSSPLTDSQRVIECGTPSIQPSPLITHGQLTSRGQWPWHVALYKNVGTDLTFFCGGSLISTRHVLTAAHCVTKTYTTKPLDENTLVVYLGKYHLKLWSEGGVQNRQVSKIHVHSKYNSTDFRSDIAVLALSSPVEYTEYVRPICMWDRSNTRIEDVEGKLGTVVGWGFDEHKMLTEELRQAKMPVVEQKTCLWSYPDFYPQFTSNMTYCAGFKNGTSVCNGDSGGGMVFPFKDRHGVERWYLRGIVSISPARNDSRVCDTSHYVVFTDVAKYLTWLDNFVE